MAKTRLATVSQKTITELELTAMALDAQLGQFLQQTLQHQPIVVETTYCVNSQVCLAWLKSTKKLKTFVCNGVNMINNYKCSFFFIPTDLNPANIATRICPPRESRQLWLLGPSLANLEELKITDQDLTEPLQNLAFIPRKQEEPTEGKTEGTLETKTQQIGPYTARHGSPEDTLYTYRSHHSDRVTAIQGKPEDVVDKDNLNQPELTEEVIDRSGTFSNFTIPKFLSSREIPETAIDMTRHS